MSGDVPIGKNYITLSMNHYSGTAKMSRARHLGYMSADMVIFLFSADDAMSFTDLEEEFSVDAIYPKVLFCYFEHFDKN